MTSQGSNYSKWFYTYGQLFKLKHHGLKKNVLLPGENQTLTWLLLFI